MFKIGDNVLIKNSGQILGVVEYVNPETLMVTVKTQFGTWNFPAHYMEFVEPVEKITCFFD